MRFNRVVVLLCVAQLYVEAVVLTRCKLAKRIMDTRLIDKTFLGNWVCLIERVSSRNTGLVVEKPHNQHYYGLFQIPQKFCRQGKKGGDCNVSCEELLTDDIYSSCRCAQQIWNREGFKFWNKWEQGCKSETTVRQITEDIYRCPEFSPPLWSRQTSQNHWDTGQRV